MQSSEANRCNGARPSLDANNVSRLTTVGGGASDADTLLRCGGVDQAAPLDYADGRVTSADWASNLVPLAGKPKISDICAPAAGYG